MQEIAHEQRLCIDSALGRIGRAIQEFKTKGLNQVSERASSCACRWVELVGKPAGG